MYSRTLLSACAIVGFTAVAGCQTTVTSPTDQTNAKIAEGWVPLDAPALTSVLHDHTHWGTGTGGNQWAVYYRADGTMSGKSDEHTDAGVYRVTEDGIYCRTWNNWGDAREGCVRMFSNAAQPGQLDGVTVSGKVPLGGAWRYEPGNPMAL